MDPRIRIRIRIRTKISWFRNTVTNGSIHTHLNRGHAVDVEAEYLGAGKADDKAEHLLLVGREGGGLDAQRAVARVAEHLLALAVPRHGVRVRLLQV
jgi:hypothetical protein